MNAVMEPEAVGVRALAHRETVSEIVAVGHAYPSDMVDNDAFLSRCRFPIPERAIAEARMKTRHWCREDETTWTMARAAVTAALADDPALAAEVDLVVASSGTTMPFLYPPVRDDPAMADLSPLVLRHLGRFDGLAIDVKACYCAGFLRALQVADALLENPNYRVALVVSAEQGSRFATAPTNRSSFCYIVGDAAGVVALRRTPARPGVGVLDHVGYTDARGQDLVGFGPDGASLVMKGSRAAEATRRMLAWCARALLRRNGLGERDVRWLLPAQTHVGVVEDLLADLGWSRDKLLWFADETGMASSGGIPSALSRAVRAGTVRKGDLILSVTTGAGLNAAGALFHA